MKPSLSLFYEHITNIDYAFINNDGLPEGNSLIVGAEILGQMDRKGILYDFSLAKNKIKSIIDNSCDHALVIPEDFNFNSFKYNAPESAFCKLNHPEISITTLKYYLEKKILAEAPENIIKIKISLSNGQNDEATCFGYTHGLKNHAGNCQRLIHGHMGKIKILVNRKREREIETKLIEKYLKGPLYFASWDDVDNKKEISATCQEKKPLGRYESIPNVNLKYRTKQGEFEATFPGNMVYFLNSETTIENLSIHFVRIIKKMTDKNDSVTICMYEGIGKGATVTA